MYDASASCSSIILFSSTIVFPESTMSSTMMTRLPLMSAVSPSACFTLPVVSVPSYELSFVETIWQLNLSLFMSSPMNMMDPLRTQRSIGKSVQPSKSALILSATLSIAADILSYVIKGLKVLSFNVIFCMCALFSNYHKSNIIRWNNQREDKKRLILDTRFL